MLVHSPVFRLPIPPPMPRRSCMVHGSRTLSVATLPTPNSLPTLRTSVTPPLPCGATLMVCCGKIAFYASHSPARPRFSGLCMTNLVTLVLIAVWHMRGLVSSGALSLVASSPTVAPVIFARPVRPTLLTSPATYNRSRHPYAHFIRCSLISSRAFLRPLVGSTVSLRSLTNLPRPYDFSHARNLTLGWHSLSGSIGRSTLSGAYPRASSVTATAGSSPRSGPPSCASPAQR